ncbi:Rad17 cell cycle checkpoint protein [Teratosphaeria destructans]|uniref:Rad17 cell cycle checkpoint protein n=1 Tax=Teratosphaeria destructans TaxID=418781 RepID=A0A9W7SZR4_9PEZI|nr:Rad17 cell cycle checkpoint protein [Teratosphaeria destructans]
MGRRRVVTIPSDDEDPGASVPPAQAHGEDEDLKRPSKRSTGKLRSVSKPRKAQQPTPEVSTQGGSSQKTPAKKPKSTKVKSKTAAKEAEGSNAKPIYSFFNAATQRQQKVIPSPSPEKSFTPQDDLEVIHDDSGDDAASVTVSRGSSTALAMRKRKLQHSQDIEDDHGSLPATHKFRKTSNEGRTHSSKIINEDRRPWTDRFAPVDLSELAVHKRKVADVRNWLETAVNGRRHKVLVLKGAAGTGKTTTVNLLAKDMGIEVSEWRNPAGFEMVSDSSLSTAAQFEEFIRRAGKMSGLALSSSMDAVMQESAHTSQPQKDAHRRQVLLIEEFPNTFSRSSSTLRSFRSTIAQYVASPAVQEGRVSPVVMVISETLLSTNTAAADSFTAHRLLGPELTNHPYIDMIEFNPIAPTYLTKALETIVVKEARKSGRRKTPGPQVLKHLAETGDVRSAVSTLEFLCLRGDDGDVWSTKVAFTKPKKARTEPNMTKAEEDALRLITNRESNLGIFHAAGRVVFNNRVEPAPSAGIAQPPSWLPQHRRTKVPEKDMNVLIDELGTDAPTYLAALHENYALSCCTAGAEETLDSLGGCIDSISNADLLSVDRFSFGTKAFSGSASDSLRQDEMSFQVAVRGLLFNLPSPVHRGVPHGGNKANAHRMYYPGSLRIWRKMEGIEGALDVLTSKVQRGELIEVTHTPKADLSAACKGVESWHRPLTIGGQLEEPPAELNEDDGCRNMPVTKIEMLLERLPYLDHIFHRRSDTFLEPVRVVCRIRQSILNMGEDDDAEGGPEDAFEGMAEQWTTDKPDAEIDLDSSRPKAATGTSRKGPSTGPGPAIPVEASVEKLVLEDDDIVDD